MKTRFLVLGFAVVALAAMALAAGAGELRARMEARLPEIDRLKTQQVIGENNRGLLQVVRNGTAEAERVVSAENADREVVYAEIAQKTSSTSEAVGRARARKIAAISRPGVWLQADDGQWYLKK